ncbi:MAG: VanW family protein, partial [Thermoleophilia bacterium]|nr:VanW family protein [Thermoleophilia bacterium]
MDALSPGAGQPTVISRRAPLRRLGAWYRRHVWSATALLIVVLAVAGFVALQVVTWDKVGDGVSVAGVSLQGFDRSAAAAAVGSVMEERVGVVRLETGDAEPLALSLQQLGISVDADATARKAYASGRHDLPLGLSVWLPGGGGDVAPVVRVDSVAFTNGLESVRAQVDVPARDARLKLTGKRVNAVPAADGREVDPVALERGILAALVAGQGYAGPVPTRVVAPEVSTVDVEARASAAAAYLARPITLRYRSTEVALSPEQMASMLSVNKGDDADDYPLTFRNDRARAALHRLFAFAETPPVDATVEVADNGSVSVTESRSGNVLDMPVLLEKLDDAASGGGLRTIFVALTPAFPKLSTVDVENMGLSALGSQFVTYFDPRNEARAGNIARAAKLVDGTVVDPGETFSLNAAMGPRTANRGFDYAPVIAADNVLRQGVGGGICQYATTLFNAVFFAGLPVVERDAHSLYISHYPIGRDATVAWGAIDFKFKNDAGKSIMIRSWIDGGALTVALVGKTGRKVSYTTSAFYDIRKPAHPKSDPRLIYDSDLGPGVIRWEQGIEGRSVKVERTVKDAAG